MAQLVKLQDYISRYEVDIYKYPSQFIRLKKEQYHLLLNRWKQELQLNSVNDVSETVDELPLTEIELKQKFLNKIFPFQLKWASSTISDLSFLDQKYEVDERLKYYVQRFPDTYLLMYEPIFKLKNAIVDGEIIMITPSEIICIKELDETTETYFIPVDDRKWFKKQNGQESIIVSPIIHLRRMENMLQSILDYHKIDFPIKRVVLAENHIIEKSYIPYKTEYVDQINYESWFKAHRSGSFPLKFRQLKTCEALLNYTQKTYIKRPEWKDEDFELTFEQE